MNSPAKGGMTKSECLMSKETTITKLQSVRRHGAIRGYSGLFEVKISVPNRRRGSTGDSPVPSGDPARTAGPDSESGLFHLRTERKQRLEPAEPVHSQQDPPCCGQVRVARATRPSRSATRRTERKQRLGPAATFHLQKDLRVPLGGAHGAPAARAM